MMIHASEPAGVRFRPMQSEPNRRERRLSQYRLTGLASHRRSCSLFVPGWTCC